MSSEKTPAGGPARNRASAEEIDLQRKYYAETGHRYDDMHLDEADEHFLALRFLDSAIGFFGIESLLDVGAGTGRAALYLKPRHPNLRIVSVEPVRELREIAYAKGLSREEMVDGDATALAFGDGAFDMVCEFGILHHIRTPGAAVAEMLRVARKGVFISDHNNFGQGSFLSRALKQTLDFLRLWPLVNYVKTGGKGYFISEGDGLAYSYSVFNDYGLVSRQCDTYLLNTMPGGINPYRTATHVALLGIKKGQRVPPG